jgi:hypothetical protein
MALARGRHRKSPVRPSNAGRRPGISLVQDFECGLISSPHAAEQIEIRGLVQAGASSRPPVTRARIRHRQERTRIPLGASSSCECLRSCSQRWIIEASHPWAGPTP